MIAALRLPTRRIAFAVALSVLAHAAIIWLPQVPLPHPDLPPLPLTAKLEVLQKSESKPVAVKPRKKQQRASNPKPPASTPAAYNEPTAPADIVPDAPPSPPAEPAAAVETPDLAETAPVVDGAASVVAAAPVAANPLPRQALLTFAVYKGLDNFKIGEVQHQLEIGGDEYTLYAVTQTVGLAKLFKNLQIVQISRGKTDWQGLHPEHFEEERIEGGNKQSLHAAFDHPSQKLRFSHGGETALPPDAQDILSIFYQLTQLPMNRETIPIFVSNGKKLEKYEFKIDAEEEITTPMGKLRSLPLRKLHAPNEDGFEIWLGLEYQLLPIKIRVIERSGEAAGEIVISSIRIAGS
ncbi:MAG: hypothetical protein FD134_793 [Gallionellaceae bacterium]|nr:MAG: hypothetical protein FD134_793 [Gallionellaceae bacterium]